MPVCHGRSPLAPVEQEPAPQIFSKIRDTFDPPKPLLLLITVFATRSCVSRIMLSPSASGSNISIPAEPGMNSRLIVSTENPASIMLASEIPCPVSAFVLLMAGRYRPLWKTSLSAKISDRSPVKVEVACAFT